ncbi:hypothetical protein PGB28_03640 [Primorskyibacter aestuariivivens]|uniref:hypothetical protein n=1 Tax=Primorskyibacter aestuariivivens TaxID=1888912 RepID=UPI0023011527|nr:hypothetical protein [Primorskyibacter aestuariivivens]MDA7427539.1 hypothetical protein [Primorskyibacter aestuariivivens]
MKYAHEGIKSLMLLNGVSTISVLTFVGNTSNGDDVLVYAMFCFALGALSGPMAFLFAYLTQLQYGNENFDLALRFHNSTYACIAFGVVLFLFGIALAGCSFIQLGQQ